MVVSSHSRCYACVAVQSILRFGVDAGLMVQPGNNLLMIKLSANGQAYARIMVTLQGVNGEDIRKAATEAEGFDGFARIPNPKQCHVRPMVISIRTA